MKSFYASVKSSGTAIPSEQLKKKKRKKEKQTTHKLDSSTKDSLHSNNKRSTTVTVGRPLPPKPGKLDPMKSQKLSKTPATQSAKPNVFETKKMVTDRDIGETTGRKEQTVIK